MTPREAAILRDLEEAQRKMAEYERVAPSAVAMEACRVLLQSLAVLAQPVGGATPGNYLEIKFAWTPEVEGMPVQAAIVTLLRDGGKSPHQLRAEAEEQRDLMIAAVRAEADEIGNGEHGQCLRDIADRFGGKV